MYLDEQKQRQRAIQWIIESVDGCDEHWAEITADHLIEKGGIFPPQKIGNSVYMVVETSMDVSTSYRREYIFDYAVAEVGLEYWMLHKFEDGEIYLTKEEAEKAKEAKVEEERKRYKEQREFYDEMDRFMGRR